MKTGKPANPGSPGKRRSQVLADPMDPRNALRHAQSPIAVYTQLSAECDQQATGRRSTIDVPWRNFSKSIVSEKLSRERGKNGGRFGWLIGGGDDHN